jgi:carboxyl-terminal processing protease
VAPDGVPEELATVWEVWNLLTKEHVDRSNFDVDKFNEMAIRGMIVALGDPFTNYVDPETFNVENEDLQGRFEGIGANVSMTQDGKLVVVAPLQGSPAEVAGIRPGDTIIEVDGESIEGLSLLGAVALIRGPRGSEVVLLIQHIGDIDPVEVAVKRGVIPLESVLLRSEPGDRIAHIRLTNFYSDTAEVLAETIEKAREDGAEGIVLDVRNNPGGLLRSVVDITNLFLDEDELRQKYENNADVPQEMKDPPVILFEVDGSGRQSNWRVGNGGIATDIPMVILANEYSASASEILVGALQDYDRATFVGNTTFGKGSVNVLRPLGNGGGLFLTFAHWYTPSGRLIQGNGVEPDIEVTSRDARTAEVNQLEKAFEVLETQLNTNAKGS